MLCFSLRLQEKKMHDVFLARCYQQPCLHEHFLFQMRHVPFAFCLMRFLALAVRESALYLCFSVNSCTISIL